MLFFYRKSSVFTGVEEKIVFINKMSKKAVNKSKSWKKYLKKGYIRSKIQYYWLNINLDINVATAYNVRCPIVKN